MQTSQYTGLARRSRPAAIVAVAGCLVFGALGAAWTLRGDHNPLDHAGGVLFASALADYPRGWANGIFLGSALVALAGSLVLVRRRGSRRVAIAAAGGALAALLVVLDSTALTAFGYVPAILIGSLIGSDHAHLSLLLSVPLALQLGLLLTMGAVGIAAAGRIRVVAPIERAELAPAGDHAAQLAQTGDHAAQAGENAVELARAGDHAAELARATARARRWTRFAMEAPLVYALTRILMFLCVPGFRFAPFGAGILWAGLGLAGSATVGALLTWGLIRPWGEVFPRWMIGLRGRRVPVTLAVVPALLVATMVAGASRTILVQVLRGEVGNFVQAPLITLPMLLWPCWAAALTMAAIAYAERRRLAGGRQAGDRPVATAGPHASGHPRCRVED